MIFVKPNDLKAGMRLAKPIYNKDGVLLYERNSRLTRQGIVSIHNFGLIGIFVLEPAEPVPPMTKEDIRFERFQTMTVFSIREELQMMIVTKHMQKIQVIAANIIKNYGSQTGKINFIQNLRSHDDYVYKHSLNTAILCAVIANKLDAKSKEQLDAVMAAIVHDIGSLLPNVFTGTDEEKAEASAFQKGAELLEKVFSTNQEIKKIGAQVYNANQEIKNKGRIIAPMTVSGKIMLIAESYDKMTAMNLNEPPRSEVEAIRTFFENPECYDETTVMGLIQAIHILSPGTCIELSDREKGVVLAANETEVLRPLILHFRDNQVVDLSNRKICGDLEISGIMKTMDNRYIMDTKSLKQQGFL